MAQSEEDGTMRRILHIRFAYTALILLFVMPALAGVVGRGLARGSFIPRT
jgi:hypothetical protein